jgi:hypothetical protein
VISAISQTARQTKKTSSTDFWRRPSKKIAGAYSASISPATSPARVESKRATASPSRAHDAEPITIWTSRTSRRWRPATV